MRVHRITLRNYRGVPECRVELSTRGTTIIEGDNEVGKTSLAEGLDLLLRHPDSSKHREIKAICPVGRDEGPEVEAEISTGPYRFVYAKRWSRRPMTSLRLIEPEAGDLSGREAHDRVDSVLDETMDRALWDALRVTQGTELAQASFGATSLGRALDRAAGSELTGERDDALWERICAERDRYWTATGQPSGDRKRADSELAEIVSQVQALEARLSALDGDAQRVADLTRELAELEERQRQHAELEAQAREQAERLASHRLLVEQHRARLETARSEHEKWTARTARRDELRSQLAEADTQLARLREKVEGRAPLRTAAAENLKALQEQHTAARQDLAAAEQAQQRATDDRDHLRRILDLEQLSERHVRVLEAQAALTDAEVTLEGIFVDDDLMAEIEDAHTEVTRAEAAASSGAVTVETTALTPLEAHLDGHALPLVVDQTELRTVTESLEVTIPGVVRLTVRAGTEARTLAEHLTLAQEELAKRCARAGVDDVTGARAALAARVQAERRIHDARETFERDLRDLTVDSLAGRIHRLTSQIDEYADRRAADPPLPTDLDAAESALQACDALSAEAQTAAEQLTKALEAAQANQRTLDVDDASLGAQLEQAESTRQRLEGQLRAEREDRSDEDLARHTATASAALTDAEIALADATAALDAEDPESVEARQANAKAAVERGAAELLRCDQELRELRAALKFAGEQGLAHDLDELVSRRTHLEASRERVEARAAAARLLADTFEQRRAEARSRYVAPFRERIEQLGRIVYGPDFAVQLDEDLRVAARTLDGTTVEFEQLSTGAAEQLGILCRLACAALVAQDGGVPVIFDDALGWTDPGRLVTMGAAFTSAARDSQVIVLTCTPGRYASVGDATVVRLPIADAASS